MGHAEPWAPVRMLGGRGAGRGGRSLDKLWGVGHAEVQPGQEKRQEETGVLGSWQW